MVLTLDGSNTGNNTISQITNSAASADLIIKNGAGTWILAAANSMTQVTSAGNVASINVNAGTLVVQNAGGFGTITQANTIVTGTATLRLDGITLTNGNGGTTSGVTVNQSGRVLSNGSSTLNGMAINASTAVAPVLGTANVSDVFTIGNAANRLTGGLATTVLHVSGPGQVLLTNTSNFAGTWSLDAGTTTLGNATALGPAATAGVAFGSSSTAKLQLNSNSISLPTLNTNATPGSVVIENGSASAATLTLNSTVNNTFAAGIRSSVST
jgi:hypothetical protein